MGRKFFGRDGRYPNENGIPYLIPCRNISGIVERLCEYAEYEECNWDGDRLAEPVYSIYDDHHREEEKVDQEMEPDEKFTGLATNSPHRCQKACAKMQ